jgi:hypothetical protein
MAPTVIMSLEEVPANSLNVRVTVPLPVLLR